MASAEFEALYRVNPDPWGYESSLYERTKYAATLAACGPGPFAEALELGGSIGVFTAALAPRCRRLVSIDAAATAVDVARARLASQPQVEVRLGSIPADIPSRSFDLVVASEILYYLEAPDLEATLSTLGDRLRPGARLVAVHWRPAGPERPFTAEQVHARLRRADWARLVACAPTDEYLLDVFERR
ncbi:MAG TPA: SAM-dependent methyltransferase [Solirubrobacteraceae bacterium]|jgi:SAM-dependent methyltransferase